jgi:hypothetical protein
MLKLSHHNHVLFTSTPKSRAVKKNTAPAAAALEIKKKKETVKEKWQAAIRQGVAYLYNHNNEYLMGYDNIFLFRAMFFPVATLISFTFNLLRGSPEWARHPRVDPDILNEIA